MSILFWLIGGIFIVAMLLIAFIFFLLRRNMQRYVRRGNLFIETDDEFMADVLAECWRTSKPVMRSRDKEND